MTKCARCGNEFDYPPALSRVDSRLPVCRPYSALEALEAVGVDEQTKEQVMAEVKAHENG